MISRFVPDTGDLKWVDFDPTKGNVAKKGRVTEQEFDVIRAKVKALVE